MFLSFCLYGGKGGKNFRQYKKLYNNHIELFVRSRGHWIVSPIHETTHSHQCSPLHCFNSANVRLKYVSVNRANKSLVLVGEQENFLFHTSAYFFCLALSLFLSLSQSHAGGHCCLCGAALLFFTSFILHHSKIKENTKQTALVLPLWVKHLCEKRVAGLEFRARSKKMTTHMLEEFWIKTVGAAGF